MSARFRSYRAGLGPSSVVVVTGILFVAYSGCSADDGLKTSTSGGAKTTGSSGSAGSGGAGASGGSVGSGGVTTTGGGPIDPTGGTGGVRDSGAADTSDANDSGRSVTPECAATRATSTDVTTVVPADIIFAIDSSGSMNEEIRFVQTYMNAFSQQIVAAGVDPHVILIGDPNAICIGAPLGSGACPTDSKLPGYAHIPSKVGSNDALNVIISTYPQWQQHLRADATKSFVVITDDNATARPNNSAAVFQTNLTALAPAMFAKWTFNGVHCFTQCPAAAAIGAVYNDLVAATMGVSGDLCLQNFQPVFNALATKIITTSGTKITCDWALPPVPAGKSFAADLVEVRRSTDGGANVLTKVNSAADCAQGGWYFDSNLNPTKILACPGTCMQLQGQTGGQIDVIYGCEAVGSCVASGSSTATSVGACEWGMPTAPPGQMLDFMTVNVRYTSASGFATNIGNVPSAAACPMFTQGWYYDDPASPKKIVACPDTCREIQVGGAEAKVDVLFGCKTKPATPH